MPISKLRQAVEALTETEELTEVTDWYSKASELVRMGLMPTNSLPYLKRALLQMEQGQYMSAPERKTFYTFVQKVMEIALLDPVVSRQVKNKAQANRFDESVEPVSEGPLDAYHSHPRANTPLSQQSKGLQAKVARDMAAHKAKKAAAIDSAKAELTAHFATKKGEREAKKSLFVSKRASAQEEVVNEGKKIGKKGNKHYPGRKSVRVAPQKDDAPSKNFRNSSYKDDGQPKYKPFSFHAIGEESIQSLLMMEDINFRETPDGMLSQLSNIIHRKRRAGGRPTDNDKKLATRAKNELRRRRNAKKVPEGVSYEDRLNASMQFFGIASLAELDPAKNKEFFTHVETQGVE